MGRVREGLMGGKHEGKHSRRRKLNRRWDISSRYWAFVSFMMTTRVPLCVWHTTGTK